MERQKTFDGIVRNYNNTINNWARDIVRRRLVGKEDANRRVDLRRDCLKDIIEDFRGYVKGIVELEYQTKKYELFLIGSED